MTTGTPGRPGDADAAWRILTWAAIAAFAAFRLPELTRYALWYDELFSLTLAQQSWGDLFRGAVADRTNPPLFYVMLKAWIDVGGESLAWMRLLPCLLGILAAAPLVALARRYAPAVDGASANADRSFALVVIAAGAASPLAVFLSNELRGYSLLLLLSALSLYATARVTDTLNWEAELLAEGSAPNGLGYVAPERQRRVVQLALVNLLLVYTHYFGWLLVGAEVIATVVWHRALARHVAVAAAAAAVAFVPWVGAVIAGAAPAADPLANVGWISVPTVGDIVRFYDALVARVIAPALAWPGAAILLIPLVLFARRVTTAPQRPWREILWFAIAPVAAIYLFSVVGDRPAFVPRYLIVAAPAWWLVVAAAVASALPDRLPVRARAAAVGVFAAFTLAAGAFREIRGGEKIPWDQVVAAIARDRGDATTGTVYSLEGFTGLPLTYYASASRSGLAVRPVRSIDSLAPPAWLVVRSLPGGPGASLGAGLMPTGLALRPVMTASVPSHSITVYRVDQNSPR